MHAVRRGRRAGHVRKGVAEEPGRSRRLHECESKAEERGTGVVPTRSRPTATPRCLTTSRGPWYRPANERERGGKDDGKSEHSGSTEEAGELSPAGASEGKRSAGLRNRRRETQRDFVLGFVSTRL